MGSRYKSNAELKAAVQKRLKRKITDDEWAKYDSIDDSPPYDNQNVTEIVTRLRSANVKPVRQNQASTALTRSEPQGIMSCALTSKTLAFYSECNL